MYLEQENRQFLLSLISPEKLNFLKVAFQRFDLDHSRNLDVAELAEVMQSMGRSYTRQQLQMAMATITGEQDKHRIDFDEFVLLMEFDVLGTSIEPEPEPAPTKPVEILYFTDVLCIWAYIAQIRIDELKYTFKNQIEINYHFVPVFGDARRQLEEKWRGRGDLAGYSNHLQEVISRFNHLTINPDVWKKVIPYSSTSCHLFLKAVQLLKEEDLAATYFLENPCAQMISALRTAFFNDLRDISDRNIQLEIAESLQLPIARIEGYINSGEAYADLSRDFQLVKDKNVTMSPTMIFNEGRQRLNGNVGYRVMEANIRELISNFSGENSWC